MATTEAEPVSNPCNRRNVLKCGILGILVIVLVQFMVYNSFPLTYQSFLSSKDGHFSLTNITIYVDNVSSSIMDNSTQTMLTTVRNINFTLNITGKETNNETTDKSSQIISNSTTLPQCPEVPPNLKGRLATFKESPPFEKLEKLFPEIEAGGRFRPVNCVSRHRVAIIIPYRDREEQLRNLLYNLHSMLTRQQIDYGIFVVDEALPTKFNRAMLLNIGYTEAIKIYDYQCFIFHDVDLIPQDDRLLYNCPTQPRHMSAAIDKFSYRLPYNGIFGGVSSLTKEQFIKVNGFSNIYFGWGGEDDDMYRRIMKNGYKVIRYPMEISRYRMIKHERDKGNKPNPKRMLYLKNAVKRSDNEGLTTLKYKLLHIEEKRLYTRVYVQIDQSEIMKNLKKNR